MASGELAPDFVFFDFSIAQTVIIGSDGRFQGRYLPLPLFLLKKFIQNCRLRIGVSPPCLLLQVGETRRRERKRAPLLNARVRVSHITMYHITGMSIIGHAERAVAAGHLPSCARLGRARAPVPTRPQPRRGKPRLYRMLLLGLPLTTENRSTRPPSTPQAPAARSLSAFRTRPRPGTRRTPPPARLSCAVLWRERRPAGYSAGRACSVAARKESC